METFSALLAICAQRPETRSFDVFFDLRLNKRLSKQSWGWWFGTLSCPLWRHCNDIAFVKWFPKPTPANARRDNVQHYKLRNEITRINDKTTFSWNFCDIQGSKWSLCCRRHFQMHWMKIIAFYIKIPLKFVPICIIDNKLAKIPVMAWCLIGYRPLPELMETQYLYISDIRKIAFHIMEH